MKELTKDELNNINGGGISLGTLALVSLGIAFIVGVVDGYLRPLKCH
jgi:class IIb bacteriocin, lactobin A/cerein 7B family